MTGNALDVSQVADTVNRSMVGYSQKQRNQAIRQGIQDPTAFAEQNKNFLSQASQPTELGGVGNQNQYDYSSLDAFNKSVDTAYNAYLDKQYGGKFDLNSILGEYDANMRDRATVIDTPEELDYATRNPFTEVQNNHGENFNYWLAGIQDPTNLQYNKYAALGIPLRGNAAYAVDNPGVQGQNVLRGTGNPYVGVADPRYMDNPEGMAELYKSYNITPEQYSASATDWAMNNTAAAQAARDTDGFGLGSLFSTVLKFTPLAPVAYIYDAYNAIQNKNLFGLAMSAFGGLGGFDALSGSALQGPTIDGGNLSSGFAGTVQGVRDTLASTLGVSPQIAGSLIGGGIQGLGYGGDLESMFRGAAAGGLGNFAGGTVSRLTKEQLGDSLAKMAGGAASGGLNSLFNKNDVVAGSLFGGMSGGLHGFLNTVGQGSEGKPVSAIDNSNNKQTAQNITKLAQLFYKNRKK